MSNLFWQEKTLNEMSQDEWESLCDGCGLCCLHKLEDEDSNEVFYTDVACKLLDIHRCRCTNYPQRQSLVDDCLMLSTENIDQFHWLPQTCAYRLLATGQPLFDWHPLISGNNESVHDAGISIRNRAFPESNVKNNDLENHIIHWVK